jgi:hypothetical protein
LPPPVGVSIMKSALLATAVSALFLLSAPPVSAQGIGFGVGPGGVGVEIGGGGRREREYDRDRDYDRGRRREVIIERRRGCHVEVTRRRNYDGDVVVRRERVCD